MFLFLGRQFDQDLGLYGVRLIMISSMLYASSEVQQFEK